MPFRQAAQGLNVLAQTAAGAYDIQLTQLQNTQRAQSTLALQRNLREMDEIFMNKLHEQLSNADSSKPITEDWLNEDFRQERMRDMFEERMGETRGLVSTPEGRMEFETRAESMWQQYEFNWRDKSTEAMRAWNLQAGQRILDGYADRADKDSADGWAETGLEHIRSMVASQTLRPELKEKWNEAFLNMVYDRSARQEIADPIRKDEKGNQVPFDENDISEMRSHSDDYIERLLRSGRITASHAEELRKTNQDTFDNRQKGIFDNTSTFVMQDLSRLATTQMNSNSPVVLDYAELIPQYRSYQEYGIISDDQKKLLDGRIYQEINRLNQRILAGDKPAERIRNNFEANVRLAAENNFQDGLDMMDIRNPESEVNLTLQHLADDPVQRNLLMKFVETYRPKIAAQASRPIDLTEPQRDMFNQALLTHGIRPNTYAWNEILDRATALSGAGVGRTDLITDDAIKQALREVTNSSISEALKTRHIGRDDIERMAQKGHQWQLAASVMHQFGRSAIAETTMGNVMTLLAKELGQMVTRTGDGSFKAEDLLDAATRIFGDPGVEFKDLPEMTQNLIRTYQYGAGALLEWLDIGGKAFMGEYGFDQYDVVDIMFDRRDNMPYFTIAYPNMSGQQIERTFKVDVSSEDHPRIIQVTRLQHTDGTMVWRPFGLDIDVRHMQETLGAKARAESQEEIRAQGELRRSDFEAQGRGWR